MRNRHIMFITKEHIKNIGISEFENLTTSCSGTIFINFELKVSTKEERHNLLCCLTFGPHLASGTNSPASASSQKSSLVRSSFQLSRFLSVLPNLCAFPVHDVTRTPSPVLSRTIVTSLSDTFVRPRVPTLTPASMFAPN